MTRPRKILFASILFLANFLALEGLCFFLMRWVDKNPWPKVTAPVVFRLSDVQKKGIEELIRAGENGWYRADLGWSLPRSGENPHGLRSGQADVPRPVGKTRVAAFGDSFTFGDEVQPGEGWPARLGAALENVEVLNFGVPMYGMDQAYLRYSTEGIRFRPQVVLIGVQPENILRHVNGFRPFYVPADNPPMTKPQFRLDGGELKLVENAFLRLEDYRRLLDSEEATLKILAQGDFFGELYDWKDHAINTPFARMARHVFYTLRKKVTTKSIVTRARFPPTSEAFQITAKILQRFYGHVVTEQARPILVMLPRLDDLDVFLKKGFCPYDELKNEFTSRKFETVDLMAAFVDHIGLSDGQKPESLSFEWKERLFMAGGHYSPRANDIVAAYLASHLNKRS